MPQSIDELYIEINAKTIKANDAIDRLVGKLNGLTTSLGKLNTSNLNGLANGVQKLGNAMQVMNTVKTADFTRLARNLSSMGNINTQGLNNTASSLSQITRAMNNIGAVSHNAVQLSEMAKNLSKFGGANVQRATVNIPLLANELRKLMITLSSAPNVSRNIIDMTNALANLSTQGSKVGSASRSIQRSLNGTHSSTVKASKGFNGLASAIGKFYASYFMVIRGVKGIWSSIESTADYIEAYNYFNVALGKIGSDWSHQFEQYGYENAEAYADSFRERLTEGLKNLSGVQVSIDSSGKGLLTETGMKNLGLNIQEVTQYASQLASVTNSVGQTGEVSLAAANAFTKLGADMSSLFNMDYSQVMKNLQSGLIGQSRALYRYGLDITNATLQTYAYELGLSKAVSEMTQAEKMQLRMIAILDQSKVSWGDLANTINSPSNLMRIFKNNLKETGMMLGQLFIPMLSKVVPILNGVTIAFKRLLVNIASFMGVELDLDAFGQGYNDLEDDLGDLEDSYGDLGQAIDEVKNQLMGFDEVNKLQDTSANVSIGADSSIDLTDEIISATDEYQKVWQEAFDKMEANSNKWANAIEKALSGIGDVFEDFALGEYFKAGEDVSQLVIDLNNFIAKAIKNVDWQGIGKNVGLFLKGIKWTEIIMSLSDVIYSAFDGLWDAWIAMMKESPIETALLTAIALTRIDVVRNALASKLSTVGGTASSPINIKTYLAITVVGIQISKKLGEMIGEAITAGDYDPQAQIDARKEYEQGLQGIIDKYDALNDKVALYVELSKNYDNLSAEDKDYVRQMAKDLKEAGIIEGIDDITGAWKGTNEELSKVIEQEKDLARLHMAQDRLVDLEAQYAEEIERNAELKEKASKFSLFHIGYQKDYEKSTETLKHLEVLLQGAQAEVIGLENQYKDSMGIIGNADLIDEAFNAKDTGKESIWQKLTKDIKAFNKTFNKYGMVDKYSPLLKDRNSQKPTGLTSLSGTGAGAIMPGVLTDDAIEELDKLVLGYEDTEEEIERNPIKPIINNGRYVNGLNNIQTLFNGMVYDINNANISPKMNNTSTFDSIANIAKKYTENKNSIEQSRMNPTLAGTSIFNTLASIKNTYESNKSNIENNKIKPTVDSSTATSQSNSLANTIRNTFSKFTATVSVKSDNNSMSSLKTKIGEMFSKMQIELSTETVGGRLLASFKKIAGFATGGFPEDGLFFANHNELVGQFSNGKTAVANNEQITQGIAQAVAPAVYNAVVSAMQSTQRGNSDVVVNIDGKQVFKAVQRQANDYTAQTGLSPFNI